MQSEGSNASSNMEKFRDPQAPDGWRPQGCYQISSFLKSKVHASRVRKKRKPTFIRYKPRTKRKHNYDHPMPLPATSKIPCENADVSTDQVFQRTKFEKREITTIEEETFQYKKHSRRSPIKTKCYQEKVASLTVVVGRLRELCLAKPEVLQNSFPEETIKLFRRIQL